MKRSDEIDFLARLKDVLLEPLAKLDLNKLSRHNRSYLTKYYDNRFENFVIAEWPYYKRVSDWYKVNVPPDKTVLELGMFVPVVPLILTWQGYRVTTVEKLDLYGGVLAPMIDLVTRHNINFITTVRNS